jgi:hypothetical protein
MSRTSSETETAIALADQYEAGMNRALASGYEEFGPLWESQHRLVIKALRSFAHAPTPVRPLPQIVQRALDVWSSDQYRSVMLPGLGARTCGKLAEALAAALSVSSTDREGK